MYIYNAYVYMYMYIYEFDWLLKIKVLLSSDDIWTVIKNDIIAKRQISMYRARNVAR